MGLQAEDVVAIEQLYAKYCIARDDGDGQAFAGCFAPGGYFEMSGDAIAGSALVQFGDDPPAGIRHVATNVYVEGDGDEARGRSYLVAYRRSGDATTVLFTGRSHDILRRLEGRWLFAERHFAAD
jgi:hypothetical protein